MKKIKLFEEFLNESHSEEIEMILSKDQDFDDFINEGFLDDVKDFIKGIKTDDDKLAKNLLDNVSKFTDVRRGFGRYESSYNFRFNSYHFELFDGYAYMRGPEIKEEHIIVKSKFFQKLYTQVKTIVNKQEYQESLKKAADEAKLKETAFTDILKKFGGISKIAEIILDKIKNPRAYWRGQIRLDRTNELVMISPIDETSEGRSLINTIIVNLSTGVTRLEQSYGAYADHKRYEENCLLQN